MTSHAGVREERAHTKGDRSASPRWGGDEGVRLSGGRSRPGPREVACTEPGCSHAAGNQLFKSPQVSAGGEEEGQSSPYMGEECAPSLGRGVECGDWEVTFANYLASVFTAELGLRGRWRGCRSHSHGVHRLCLQGWQEAPEEP